jgi:uncharacterized membrane protein YedE/YeeE
MTHFTPVASLVGGLLIGLSSAALLLCNGKIAGISGIVGGLLNPIKQDTSWRILFLAGLLSGGLVMHALSPHAFAIAISRSPSALIFAGLLVGFGTRLGSGCTSGHGVCGISRLSPRSIIATLTFIATGAVTVFIVNHLLGGAL